MPTATSVWAALVTDLTAIAVLGDLDAYSSRW
jgi:hypothetical protein